MTDAISRRSLFAALAALPFAGKASATERPAITSTTAEIVATGGPGAGQARTIVTDSVVVRSIWPVHSWSFDAFLDESDGVNL